MAKIPSNYNDMLRALGMPELPDCEECGLQIRRNMESPWNLIEDGEDGQPEIHRFCGVDCLKVWTDRRAAERTDG